MPPYLRMLLTLLTTRPFVSSRVNLGWNTLPTRRPRHPRERRTSVLIVNEQWRPHRRCSLCQSLHSLNYTPPLPLVKTELGLLNLIRRFHRFKESGIGHSAICNLHSAFPSPGSGFCLLTSDFSSSLVPLRLRVEIPSAFIGVHLRLPCRAQRIRTNRLVVRMPGASSAAK
jgi:hypothetical protein